MSDKIAEDGTLSPRGQEASPGTSAVARFLLRKARQDAERIRAAGAADADATLARARAEAEALLSRTRAAGAAEGAALAAADLARARREARAIVLRARRAECERLRDRVQAAMSALLRDDPVFTERLRILAGGLAGPGARIDERPGGGFVAHGEGTRVDCTVPALADRAVEALGAKVERLWEP